MAAATTRSEAIARVAAVVARVLLAHPQLLADAERDSAEGVVDAPRP